MKVLGYPLQTTTPGVSYTTDVFFFQNHSLTHDTSLQWPLPYSSMFMASNSKSIYWGSNDINKIWYKSSLFLNVSEINAPNVSIYPNPSTNGLFTIGKSGINLNDLEIICVNSLGEEVNCQPKRTKFRKQHKGRNRGLAHRGNSDSFGEFGLKATGRGRMTARQIEAGRRAMTRAVQK